MEPKQTKSVADIRRPNRDEPYALLAPLKEAMLLFTRMVLAELAENTRVLVVGSGPGPELTYLGRAFPTFRFTAVEPNTAMLDTCQQRCEESGIIDRCTFHNCTLETLPGNERYDAATSILVSHYQPDMTSRRRFFSAIANRLVPDGVLVSADLISDIALEDPDSLLDLWTRTMRYGGAPLPPHVPAITTTQLESIVGDADFDNPRYFYQAIMIHAWFARKRIHNGEKAV